VVGVLPCPGAPWARVLRLSDRVSRLLLRSMSSEQTGSGRKLAEAFVIAKRANSSGTFAEIGAAARVIGQFGAAALLAEHFAAQTRIMEHYQRQASALVAQSFQTTALKVQADLMSAVGKSAFPRLGLAAEAFRQRGLASEALRQHGLAAEALRLDIAKALAPKFDLYLKIITQLPSADQRVLANLDTSLSENATTAPVIEAATDAVQRAHPWLSRSTARMAVVLYFNLLTAAVIVYGLVINPLAMLLLVASGLTAKDGGRVAGQLFDKINPSDPD
jgi:hypothetical protein